ncbi:glycosyltransferase [Planctomycetota bacterium]|nr:glycosyltransferase [Planctomycetota bacterium]
MNKPLVSIALITYKHEQYIQEAMDGIMMQEGIEDFEIVVGDDHSPDRTVEFIKERTKSHGNARFLQRPANVGMHQNWLDTINACKGRCIALIEGDDLWTDPKKLSVGG